MSTAAWMNERIVKENKQFPPAEQSPNRVCGKTQKVGSRLWLLVCIDSADRMLSRCQLMVHSAAIVGGNNKS